MFFTAMLITYIKGGTPAQLFLERGSVMTRATFVIAVKFVEDHLMNIHVQFGFNHICSF